MHKVEREARGIFVTGGCSTPGAHSEKVGLDGSHYHIFLVDVMAE